MPAPASSQTHWGSIPAAVRPVPSEFEEAGDARQMDFDWNVRHQLVIDLFSLLALGSKTLALKKGIVSTLKDSLSN